MGIFDGIRRASGSLRTLSYKELEEKHEALRRRYVAGEDHLYNEMHRYDDEMTRRKNEAYDRENPNPPKPRHGHGWHLPNDD